MCGLFEMAVSLGTCTYMYPFCPFLHSILSVLLCCIMYVVVFSLVPFLLPSSSFRGLFVTGRTVLFDRNHITSHHFYHHPHHHNNEYPTICTCIMDLHTVRKAAKRYR